MRERSKGAEVKSASTSSLLLPSPEEVFQRRRRGGGGGKEGRGALLGAKGSSPHPFTLPPHIYAFLPSFPFPLFPGDLQSLCSGSPCKKAAGRILVRKKRVEGNKTDGAAEGRKRVYVVVRDKKREEAA